jgi:histone deacetylase HOS3
MESIEEPIPLTAARVAADYFTKELLAHEQAASETETLVVLHDACYGHRFSRLKTTKTSLSMIVERPERLHASVLGASTAYVRLGKHHSEAENAPHPDRQHSLKPPFTIRRSGRTLDVTSPFVTNVHGKAWMNELQRMCRAAPEKLAAGAKELDRRPPPGEVDVPTLHEGDLYLANESQQAFEGALGAVADAVDAIFSESTKTKRAFVAVRPPGHHCSANEPSGFCWLNNVHVGIEYAAQMYGLTHAAILDFDLHHGDGSQAITWERNSQNNIKRLNARNNKQKLGPDIGYYSIHDINSYPCEMGDDEKVQAASLCIENAHGQSIWNVHLQPWKTETEFWKLYETRYKVLLDKTKVFLEHHASRLRSEGKASPKGTIFISAGFDASEWEGSGMQRHKVSVPTDFYARFTQDVVKLAQEVDGCEGRVISVLEGGYSDRALCSGVLSHLSGLCAAPVTASTNGIGALMDLSSHMTGLSINGAASAQALHFDKSWWSAESLTALEMKVNLPPPPQGKKARAGPQPTYATPTESFAYKVVDTDKFARSIAGTMRDAPVPERAPTPPPPEVDWVIATQELSKLLIPTHRQTKSFTAEELGGVRLKKEAPARSASPANAGGPRQLRDRKMKGPVHPESVHSDELDSVRSASRSESRTSRRETISVLPSEEPIPSQRRVSRRLSAGSTLDVFSSTVDADAPPVPSLPPASVLGSNVGMKPPTVPSNGGTLLANKKVRAPAAKPRKSATSSSAPTSPRKAAAPLVPSKQDQPHPLATSSNGSDMDSLTTGLKKVTLKLSSTKEEHDRKQKEKLDAERKARAVKAAETRRVNAAAKKAALQTAARDTAAKPVPASAVVTAVGSASIQKPATLPALHKLPTPLPTSKPVLAPENVEIVTAGHTQVPASSVHLPSMPGNALPMNGVPPANEAAGNDIQGQTYTQRMELPQASNSHAAQPVVYPSYQQTSTPSVFDAYRPPPPQSMEVHYSMPAPQKQQQQTPVHPQPPASFHPIDPTFDISASSQYPDAMNVSSYPAPPAEIQRTLPVWSSTGPIPFGKAPARSEEQATTAEVPSSIWDVPVTPKEEH